MCHRQFDYRTAQVREKDYRSPLSGFQGESERLSLPGWAKAALAAAYAFYLLYG
jgi:hypothetical protein